MTTSDVDRTLRELIKSPNNHCFACGPHNPCGLHLQFERVDGVIRAHFVPGEWHEGWEGIVHGGILATVLDEAMAYTLYFEGIKGVTARMDLRYRAPVHQGDDLVVEAEIVRSDRRILDVEGRICRGRTVVVEGSSRFMKVGSLDKATSV